MGRPLTPEEIFAGLTEAPKVDVKVRSVNNEPTPEEVFAAAAAAENKSVKRAPSAKADAPATTTDTTDTTPAESTQE